MVAKQLKKDDFIDRVVQISILIHSRGQVSLLRCRNVKRTLNCSQPMNQPKDSGQAPAPCHSLSDHE